MMLHHWWRPAPWASLLVIVGLLAVSIVASLVAARRDEAEGGGDAEST